jgi:hypothetical protein
MHETTVFIPLLTQFKGVGFAAGKESSAVDDRLKNT